MDHHLHFDCFSGISGDMVLGALVDVRLPFNELVDGLKGLRLPGFALTRKHVMRGAVHATKIDVRIKKGFEKPLSLTRIRQIVRASTLPQPVKECTLTVFHHLAEAEGLSHGVGPSHVHFHEVGVVDSFVDVVGAILGCHLLGISHITASPVNVGSGTVTASHGALPVPGPAVAALARGIPIYSGGPAQELTTPTGMALLRTLVQEFGPLPLLRPTAIGYGAGSADPKNWPNVLRVFVGPVNTAAGGLSDRVVQLETNLDDLNPQAYELLMERLFGVGALDVTLTSVMMKRGRPGIVLTALVSREKTEAALGVLFRDTTALGVRIQEVQRRLLTRQFAAVRVRGSEVRIKLAEMDRGETKAAPEYLDCKRIAEQTGCPLKDVMEEALLAYRQGQGNEYKAKGKSKK